MPARTKRRAKFIFGTRRFVWWIDADRWLRICSSDKKFIIAFPIGRALDAPCLLGVIGSEFPGVDRTEKRPVWLVVPEPVGTSMGAWVDCLLRWSFDPKHELIRSNEPPKFA